MFTMLAVAAHGSVASMPLDPAIRTFPEARIAAKSWLDMYDHGFAQAIVSSADNLYAESVEYIFARVMFNEGNFDAHVHDWLIDTATAGTPEVSLGNAYLIPADWIGAESEPTVDEVDRDSLDWREERRYWEIADWPKNV